VGAFDPGSGLRYNGFVSDAGATTWGEDGEAVLSADADDAVAPTSRARWAVRLLSAAFGLLLGLTIVALNVSVLVGDLRLRLNGVEVTVTVTQCVNGGRTRTCEGSYTVAGHSYDHRLLLGGDGARVGQTVRALVDHQHPADASTTGLAASIEAGLFALGGLLLVALSAHRVWVTRRDPPPPSADRSARRSRASRARVWDGASDGSDDAQPLADG
jgi:hypothetical protein